MKSSKYPLSTSNPEPFSGIYSNKTLFIHKFTFEDPIKPELVEKLQTLGHLFAHFKPSITLELYNQKGEEVEVSFKYDKIEDFKIKSLINQSSLLKNIAAEKDTYINFSERIQENYKGLEPVIQNPTLKAAFINVMKSFALELEQKIDYELEYPSFDEDIKIDFYQVPPLEVSLRTLEKVGGLNFLETIIEGVANMNPIRKARKAIFLTDEWHEQSRLLVYKKLLLLVRMLGKSTPISTIIEECSDRAKRLTKLFNYNIKTILKTSYALEVSYRTASLFYKNAGMVGIRNVTILNASIQQLTNLDNPTFIEYVAQVLKSKYDTLDL